MSEHTKAALPRGSRLKNALRDVGMFSLAGLCSCLLYTLFENDCDREFNLAFTNAFVTYLGLPDNVKVTMRALQEQHSDIPLYPFVNSVIDDAKLAANADAVVQDLIWFCISNGVYDSRSRVLVYKVAGSFSVPAEKVRTFEESVAGDLIESDHVVSDEDLKRRAQQDRSKRIRRGVLITAATLGGGVLLGLTGGLAAPLVASGAAAVIGGTGVAMLGSTAGVAVVSSLFGAAGATLVGYKMKRRVGELEEFAFEVLSPGKDLTVAIAISGWVPEDKPGAFCEPWHSLRHCEEQYCLRYESRYLSEVGKMLKSVLNVAVSVTATEALKTTILSGLITAIAWPSSILTLSGLIDAPWNVCLSRTIDVGCLLADTLVSRHQGRRPVTLYGYSLGARVIFYCLVEMSKRKGSEGIIEDVVLLGAPVSNCAADWEPFSSVVSGKIVNGYCRNDWLLSFLHRTSSLSLGIAGLRPVEWKNRRVINLDLTDIVSGHFEYGNKIKEILLALDVRTRPNSSATSAVVCV